MMEGLASQSINAFSQSGLPGLVILALFATLWGAFFFVMLRLMDRHDAERKEIMAVHLNERREFLDVYQKISQQADVRQKEANEAIRDLTKVVDFMNNRHRRFDDGVAKT